MLCSLGSLLLRQASKQAAQAPAASRLFRAVADVEIDFADRETLKKYVGVRDHFSKEPGTKGLFLEALRELMQAVQVLPQQSDYRKAVEATCNYRVKVCQQNASDAAVEEVLDAHMEELIKECKEELRLLPVIQSRLPAKPVCLAFWLSHVHSCMPYRVLTCLPFCLRTDTQPWNVPAKHTVSAPHALDVAPAQVFLPVPPPDLALQVPLVTYTDASEFLNAKK